MVSFSQAKRPLSFAQGVGSIADGAPFRADLPTMEETREWVKNRADSNGLEIHAVLFLLNKQLEGILMTRTILYAALLLFVLGATSESLSQQEKRTRFLPFVRVAPPITVKKTGWWIRVDSTATRCSSIGFNLGKNKGLSTPWRKWERNQATEFDVPDSLMQEDKLYLLATGAPEDSTVRFCVFYKSNGVRLFEFEGDDDERMTKEDQDPNCVP